MLFGSKKNEGEKKQKSSKKKNEGGISGRTGKKSMDISLLASSDNVLFSKRHITAFYKIPGSQFDFISTRARVYEANRLAQAFNNLMSDRQEPLDVHILTTSDPFDVNAWERQVYSTSSSWDKPDDFDEFIGEMHSYLESSGFTRKVVYVGVVLGARGAIDVSGMNPLEAGFKGAYEKLKDWLNTMIQVPTEAISEAEEDDAKNREERVFRVLEAGIRAERVRSEELLLVIKRMFYPYMPPQFLDVDHSSRLGPGDILLEGASVVTEYARWLKFEQIVGGQELTSYRSALTLTKFPKSGDYPTSMLPFFYVPEMFHHLPLTTYARLTLRPVEKVKGEIQKRKDYQRDEIKNYSMGRDGLDAAVEGAPADIVESLENIQDIEYETTTNKMPWVIGSYRIIIEGDSPEMLKEDFELLRSTFSDMQIGLTMSAGDQLDLFLEQMPGDRKRVKSFDQVTNLNMVAASGFNISADVGDTVQESAPIN